MIIVFGVSFEYIGVRCLRPLTFIAAINISKDRQINIKLEINVGSEGGAFWGIRYRSMAIEMSIKVEKFFLFVELGAFLNMVNALMMNRANVDRGSRRYFMGCDYYIILNEPTF